MYCYSQSSRCGNDYHLNLLTPSSYVIAAANSNTAWRQTMSVLHNNFVWVLFLPRIYVLSIHHHHWTNHMDQKMIDQIPKPFQRGRSSSVEQFWFNDGHLSIFGPVFFLYTVQKRLLVLGSITHLILRIHITPLALLPKWSPLAEWIKDMHWNETQSGRCSDFGIIIGQLLAGNLHGEV